MSNRERWILYPLLFLALGSSLRDKLLQRVDTRVVVGQELQVSQAKVKDLGASGTIACDQLLVRKAIELHGAQGEAAVQIVVEPEGGGIYLRNAAGKEVLALGVDDKTGVGVLQTKDEQSHPRVTIAGIGGGGAIVTAAGEHQHLLALEHDGQGNGVISIYDAEGRRYVVLRAGPMPEIRAPEEAQPLSEPASSGDQPAGGEASGEDAETAAPPAATQDAAAAGDQPTGTAAPR
ncbi:MAG: hypothetical protein K1X74_00360 [Pirellulales bacterium]|nr:hypothetical protein [Pirellulales bacterium]